MLSTIWNVPTSAGILFICAAVVATIDALANLTGRQIVGLLSVALALTAIGLMAI